MRITQQIKAGWLPFRELRIYVPEEREQLAVSPHPPAYFRKLQQVDVLRGGGLCFEGDHHYRSLRASEVMDVRKIANVVEHAAEGRGGTLRGEERVEIQSTGSDGGCSSRPATQDHRGWESIQEGGARVAAAEAVLYVLCGRPVLTGMYM